MAHQNRKVVPPLGPLVADLALALAVPIVALVTGLMTAGILAATWKISPRRE